MTKEQFERVCRAAGIHGNTYESGTLLMWVPWPGWIIRIMYDTDGSQLLPEDYTLGYNDYIDYKITVFDGSELVEGDGGLYMFDNENGTDIIERTWEMLSTEVFNEVVPEIRWMTEGEYALPFV